MGSTVPAKFTLSQGGLPVGIGIHTLQVAKFSSQTTVGTPIDATPQDAATVGNQFHFTEGEWRFNLDTKNTGMSRGV
jgi:hypothetical protein